MKWLFYIIVFIYMFYRAVYGAKDFGMSVDVINYDQTGFLPVGSHKTVNCRTANKNQKAEWIDPAGNVIKRNPGKGNVFAQEHYLKGRIPVLVLTFSNLAVHDSGVYQCRSGEHTQNVSVCVIEPSVFVDTPTELTVDLGRAITLTCQAKGAPEPSLIWSVNYETLKDDDDSDKYRVTTKYNSQGFESLLTVKSLTPVDAGVYSCLSVQRTPDLEDCALLKETNITLNVNYPPEFEDGSDVKLVYGKLNQAVDLTCTAKGYPLPTYRWFREDGDLIEIDEKLITYSKEDNQATWTITANAATFGQKFKCRAINANGQAEKVFTLLKMEKPRRPSEIIVYDASDSLIKLNVTWDEAILFPVEGKSHTELNLNKKKGFHIQSLKTDGKRKPKDLEWRKSEFFRVNVEEDSDFDSELTAMPAILSDLEEESQYWIRVRATNNAGDGFWSEPTLVATVAKQEEVEQEETPKEEAGDDPQAKKEVVDEANMSDGTFYGIFFAGGILIVAAVCMFAVRLV